MAKKSSTGMRCLSIRQPWAWLVCAGMKRIENRTWSTDYRGTIAIHASTSNSVVKDYVRDRDTDSFSVDDFAYGAIIGLADVADVRVFGREHEDDGFACGPYCWHMSNPRMLKTPIPMLGKLNLFYLDEAISDQLRAAETYVVDLNSSSREAQIAAAMIGDPDPIAGYSYTLQELDGRINDDELEWRVERMLEIDPNNAEGNFCRLRLAVGSGRMANASEDVTRLMQCFSEDAEVLELCASASYALGDYAKTIEISDIAMEIDPEIAPRLLFRRGVAKLAIGRLEEALADVSQSRESAETPDDKSLVYNFLARIQRRLKNFRDAEQAISFAIFLRPTDPNNHFIAATIAEDKGDLESAREFARKSLEVDPDYTEAADLLARLSIPS